MTTPPVIFSAQDKAALVAMGMGAGFSTLLEEIGWTGYAIPRLRLSHSVLKTGLITGVLWAAWHLLVNFWSNGDANGALSLSPLLLSLFFSWTILTSFRVLMVWVYEHTQSLLVAWLMHFTLTAGNVIFAPTRPGGATGPIWSLSIGAALWAVVVALARRGRLEGRGRPSLKRRLPIQANIFQFGHRLDMAHLPLHTLFYHRYHYWGYFAARPLPCRVFCSRLGGRTGKPFNMHFPQQ